AYGAKPGRTSTRSARRRGPISALPLLRLHERQLVVDARRLPGLFPFENDGEFVRFVALECERLREVVLRVHEARALHLGIVSLEEERHARFPEGIGNEGN